MAILKEVLFNDGEGVDLLDFNNAQRFINAFMLDGMIGGLSTDEGSDVPTSTVALARCIGNGGAVWADPAVDRKARFAEGIIIQPAAATPTITGDSPKMLAYYVKEADISSLVRPVATVNPRWDILSVGMVEATGDNETRHFEDAVTDAKTSTSQAKRRRVVATFTWTQGAEAATPTEPATPAGHVKICAVRVTPAMTLFDVSASDLRDHRIPVSRINLSQLAIDTEAFAFNGATATKTAVTSAPGLYSATTNQGGGTERVEICFISPLDISTKRLAAIKLRGKATATASHTLNLRNEIGVLWTSVALVPTSVGWATFSDLTLPVWSNGSTAGYAAIKAAITGRLFLEWEVGLNEVAAEIHKVTWQYWGF